MPDIGFRFVLPELPIGAVANDPNHRKKYYLTGLVQDLGAYKDWERPKPGTEYLKQLTKGSHIK